LWLVLEIRLLMGVGCFSLWPLVPARAHGLVLVSG
jgi:hypothetical protein